MNAHTQNASKGAFGMLWRLDKDKGNSLNHVKCSSHMTVIGLSILIYYKRLHHVKRSIKTETKNFKRKTEKLVS